MNIEVGNFYHISTMTEPVEVVADNGDGSYTVRSVNLFNETVEWGLEHNCFRKEARPVITNRQQTVPLFPAEVTEELVRIEKPLVLGCYVSWSEVDQGWEVTSAKTGESVYLKANGHAHCSPGVSSDRWDAAINHAIRCLDLIKTVV